MDKDLHTCLCRTKSGRCPPTARPLPGSTPYTQSLPPSSCPHGYPPCPTPYPRCTWTRTLTHVGNGTRRGRKGNATRRRCGCAGHAGVGPGTRGKGYAGQAGVGTWNPGQRVCGASRGRTRHLGAGVIRGTQGQECRTRDHGRANDKQLQQAPNSTPFSSHLGLSDLACRFERLDPHPLYFTCPSKLLLHPGSPPPAPRPPVPRPLPPQS